MKKPMKRITVTMSDSLAAEVHKIPQTVRSQFVSRAIKIALERPESDPFLHEIWQEYVDVKVTLPPPPPPPEGPNKEGTGPGDTGSTGGQHQDNADSTGGQKKSGFGLGDFAGVNNNDK